MSKLAQTAYEQIRERIASGEWNCDTPLSEPSLAKALQVSRTPIREAIRRLQSEGLLEQRRGQGTYIRSPSRLEMVELFEIRILLEPFAAARVARKRSPALLRELAGYVAAMKRIVRRLTSELTAEEEMALRREHRALDRAFHRAVLTAAGNRSMQKLVDAVGILSLTMGSPVHRPPDLVKTLTKMDRFHATILAAIRGGDAAAARKAMREHLLAAKRRWGLQYLAWLERENETKLETE